MRARFLGSGDATSAGRAEPSGCGLRRRTPGSRYVHHGARHRIGANEPELVPGAVLTITPAKTLRCEFGPSAATCLVPGDGFVHAPKVQGGRTPAAVSVDASGALTWIPDPGEDPFHLAEVAGGRFSILGYDRTYTAAGWTITPDTHGTTITNDRTNHGMFISVDNATVNSV